jgi:transposase
MRTATTQPTLLHGAATPTLYMAFELGEGNWKVGFSTGLGQDARLRVIRARDLAALVREIEAARKRFGLAADAPVRSCYEAGRDGFWLHRWLVQQDVDNHVIDSSSIEVNRRRRRAKTDRLDAGSLLRLLQRYGLGDRRVWHVVRVPSPEVEDRRQLHRELTELKRERGRLTNRIHGLLANQGICLQLRADFGGRLDDLSLWDGSPLPPDLQERIARSWERARALSREIQALESRQREALRSDPDPALEQVRQLTRLRGIGFRSAWVFTMEFFAWREFRNRREIGALAGLTPTPYQSGDSNHELGISKAGNRLVRALAVEVAWSWLRRQPQSELAQWYRAKFAQGGSRLRRIGIVALARRLLIELWVYLETGTPPAGALFKTP